jgi:tetratricopeptide (TPR) repeat protein
MAISAIKLREYNKAVEWTNQVLQINPSSAKALARNATAQGYLHQWDKATQSYEACFKSSDNLSQVFESLQTFQNYFVDQNRHTPVNHPLWGYDTSTLGPNPMFKLLNVENGKQLYHSDPSVRMIANKSIGCLLGKALADSLGSSKRSNQSIPLQFTYSLCRRRISL